MSWKRLATFALGGVSAAVGALVPPAAGVLLPAGVFLIGLATKWPGDRTKRDQQAANARERAASRNP